MGLDPDDELIGVGHTTGNDEIVLGSRNGMAVRFNESDVRAMGRGASGVKGISLRPGDSVVEMDVLPSAGESRVVAKHYIVVVGLRSRVYRAPVHRRRATGVGRERSQRRRAAHRIAKCSRARAVGRKREGTIQSVAEGDVARPAFRAVFAPRVTGSL